VKRLRRLALGILAAVLLAVAGLAALVVAGLPSRAEVRALARSNPASTSLMRQRDAEARRAGRVPRRVQQWAPIARVSRHLIHAVITAEDARFFGHSGVDWDAVRESAEANLQRGRFARGGSTITQQLAKNLFFTTEKSPLRKLRELVVARWLEQELSKRRILELYLNVIEWGDGLYGCEAAAHRYYGRSSADLGEAEAAGLAAMIPSPRRLNPLVSPERHARAQRRVLWLMALAGYAQKAAATIGAEPPPEPVEEGDDEPAAEPAPEPAGPTPPPSPTAPEPDSAPAEASPPGEPVPSPTAGPGLSAPC
jgi:monofunctional glycosyltransferase